MWLALLPACGPPDRPAASPVGVTGSRPSAPTAAAPTTSDVPTGSDPSSPGDGTDPGSTLGFGTGRIRLIRWPPATGVIEDDTFASITGWPESRLGAVLARIPDVDGDVADELYAWGDDHDDAVIAPLEVVGPGDQDTSGLLLLRDTRIWASVGDVTGDGGADLIQMWEDGLAVVDGVALGAPGELQSDDGVVTIVVNEPNYGWPSAAVGDLDGVPGDEVVVGSHTFGYGPGPTGWGRVDLYVADTLVGGAAGPLATITGRRTGEPYLSTAGGLPDVTGDGLPEVFSSQSEGDVDGVYEAGEVAVLDGLLAGGDHDYDDAFVRIAGESPYDHLGVAVVGLPDLDGDGTGELGVAGAGGVFVFRGAELAAGGVLYPSDAAVTGTAAESPVLLPDLDDDGVPELGAWLGDAFHVWSGSSLPVAAGGDLASVSTLGTPCTFRDAAAWAFGPSIGVAFVRDEEGWIAAFGVSGEL